jgi:hypothetical protein
MALKGAKHTLQTYTLEAIIKPMKQSEKRRHEKILQDLNKRHKEILKADHDGFLYGGEFYMPAVPGTVVTLPTLAQRKTLDQTLWDEMEAYVKDVRATSEDIQFVQQVLTRILANCTSFQDVRDTLPDFLFDVLPETRTLPRIQAEGFTLNDNIRAMKQFAQMKEKLAVYRMGRLMY